jgi:hypothetical protein
MFRYRELYCSTCQRIRRFRKRAPDHRLHLRFTLLTLGLWGLGWLILSLLSLRRNWRCQFCYARPRLNRFEPPSVAGWRPAAAEESAET